MAKLLTLSMTACLLALAGCKTVQPGPTPPPAPKQITVNGVSLKYVEQGQGAPVLFVHGSNTDHRLWEPQRETFAPHYRFIALDQRYFGSNPWPDKGEKFSQATHLDDLAAFIRELKTGPVHLVGWSYSGTTLLVFAVQHPELVKSVFVYEPSVGTWMTDPADLKVIGEESIDIGGPVAAALQAGDNKLAVKTFMDRGNNTQPGSFDALPPEVRTMMLENANMVPLLFAAPPPPTVTCEQLAQIKVPIAIARGELSRPLFRVIADTASHCIPGSRLIIVPNARHLWPMQEPAAFGKLLGDFLKTAG